MNKSEIMELVDEYAECCYYDGVNMRKQNVHIETLEARAAIEAALPDVPEAENLEMFNKGYALGLSQVDRPLPDVPTVPEELVKRLSFLGIITDDEKLKQIRVLLAGLLLAAPEPALDVKIQGTNPVVSQISGNVNDKEPAQAEQPTRVRMDEWMERLLCRATTPPGFKQGEAHMVTEEQVADLRREFMQAAQAEQPRNEPVQQEHANYNVWQCRIYVSNDVALPRGFDAPPRAAAEKALQDAGIEYAACFSGWGFKPVENEVAVIENRLPRC
jgi:hypothetical protein